MAILVISSDDRPSRRSLGGQSPWSHSLEKSLQNRRSNAKTSGDERVTRHFRLLGSVNIRQRPKFTGAARIDTPSVLDE